MPDKYSMYLTNKYSSWYYDIIINAMDRPIDGYIERHHIIPKSLGGTNDKTNLVALTAREHFLCHMLLTKMVVGKDKKKMIFAAMMLGITKSHNDIRLTGRTYDILKSQFSLAMSETRIGIIFSDKTKQKMSDAKKGRPSGRKGKMKHSKETKVYLSEIAKGRTVWNTGLKTHRWVKNELESLYTRDHINLTTNLGYVYGRNSWKKTD